MSEQSGEVVRTKGTVKWFDEKKGYGFIRPEGAVEGNARGDVFVHAVQLRKSGIEDTELEPGDLVEFEMKPSHNGKGPQAINVKLVRVT